LQCLKPLWNNKITILGGSGAKVLACFEFTSAHKKQQGDARRFLGVEKEKAAWDSTPPDLKLLGISPWRVWAI
jgi:hypothetical protein